MHDQNKAILKSLLSVAWADGVFAAEEREMMDALIAAFEASDDETKEILEYAAVKRSLDDIPITEIYTDDRRILLQHAVLLTYVDGTQHETEKHFIDALCKKLRIPDEEAKSLVGAADARAKRFLSLL
jgi:uncharacterized tellurite resistance protein B-like protein